MVAGILGRLFGGSGDGEGPRGSGAILTAYLAHLDQVEPGLTAKAVRYIQQGEGRTVLATLQAKQTAIDQAAEAISRQSRDPQSQRQQVSLLFGKAGAHVAWLARACEVLGRAWSLQKTGYQPLSDRLHPAVKALAVHLQNHQFDIGAKAAPRLTFDQVLAVTEAVGGCRADLLEAAFARRYGSILETFADQTKARRALLATDVTELTEALSRMDAWGREQLLVALNSSGTPLGAGGIDFLFAALDDGSAKVREAMRARLVKEDRAAVLARAAEALNSPKAALRTAMVQLLGDIGDPAATAILAARREVEKSQSVRSLIDQFLHSAQPAPAPPHDRAGYESVGGDWVDLPAAVVLVDTDEQPFGRADLMELEAIDTEIRRQEDIKAAEAKAKGWKYWRSSPVAKDLVAAFNRQYVGKQPLVRLVAPAHFAWMTQALQKITPARRLWLALTKMDNLNWVLGGTSDLPTFRWLQDSLDQGAFDLRTVFRAAEAAGVPGFYDSPYNRKPTISDGSYTERYLRHSIANAVYSRVLADLPPGAVWPLLAENMALLAEHLPPKSLTAADNLAALDLLALLPALPKSLLQSVLFTALGEAAQPRKVAQAMLDDVAGIDAALVAALGDKRQITRANAAALLARRGATAALSDLVKSLKSEKSDSARAALISAIQALGGDTTPYLGARALEAEAQALVGKLKPVAEEFLRPDHMPALHWADGTPVPPVVPEAWIRLACKLKNPGDAGMFGLYLDQLRAQDAAAFGDWLLQGWIGFDTYKHPADEHYKLVLAQAQQAKTGAHAQWYADNSVEEVAALFLAGSPNPYVNSGAETKGVLALAIRATPALQARVAAAYLKEHGKRTAQAKAVIDMLVASGSPEAVQRVVATATRFKQKTVREHAEAQVTALADQRGWTADTLADRSIPTGGLEEGGQMVLEVGEDAKPYTVRLGSDLQLRLFNADGREVKALPAAKDANTTEAKAQLAAAKAAVKSAATQQAARLYEAMLAGRRWTLADWQADISGHPILARLTERVIWRGLTQAGELAAVFRPTPEGDRFDDAGDDADLSQVALVDLAHGSQFDPATVAAWLQHLKDFEVTPLFPQLTRPVLRPDPADPKATAITDRKGWLIESLRLRSEAARFGYDKGPAEDGGYYVTFLKTFPSAGVQAVLQFTGSGQEGRNHMVALQEMTFERVAKGRTRALTLTQVPPLLLSECWCDLHDIALKGAYDADWEKKVEY